MIIVHSDGSHSADHQITKSAVVVHRDDVLLYTFSEIQGEGWSDVSEYYAIRLGLSKLLALGLENESITWYNDSQFVIRQMLGVYKIRKNKGYTALALECVELKKAFKCLKWRWIPREQNKEADKLSKL